MRRRRLIPLCGMLLAWLVFPGTAAAQAPNQSPRFLRLRLAGVLALVFLWLFVLAPTGSGQGSRKDDIVLNRFGQPVAGATVSVCTSGATGTPCSPLAAIYSDIGLTQPLANPLASDGQGNYHFYAAPGRYVLQLSGAGVSTTTIPDVLLAADPTAPSYQSLTVTQNITAASLNLSGNLSVSGGVSSPSAVSAPEAAATTPTQLGPDWYPPTTSTATCQVPAAPTVQTETISSAPPFAAGNFSSSTTYYVQVRVGNRNGWTPPSASTAYTPASGSTNRVLIQLSDWTWRSGCYKFQAQIATSASGPFYPAQAETLPTVGFSSLTRGSNGVVTAATTAAHGFIPGETITVSGVTGGTTSFNGTFTLIGQQVNSPTTLFWFQSGNAESANTNTGTGTVLAGLGSDSFSHMAPGDFIVATVPTSGTAFGSTNTATIDPDQAALNSACNYSANTCTGGHLVMPQGIINATTPLIVTNQQSVLGDTAALAGGKSERSCAWKDPNLACVMVMGVANGVRIEGLDIESQGHGLMLTGWGPGFASSHQFIRNNSIDTSDTTGQYSAIYSHVNGAAYNVHIENNFLTGGLAAVQIDASSGGWWFLSGARWNTATGLPGTGKNGNALLSVSSVTDPDRAAVRGAFPNGVGMVEVSNMFTESATGVQFDAVNLGLKLKNVLTADPSANSGTPAFIRIGTDANATSGNFNPGFVIEDLYLQPATNVASDVQLISNTDSIGSALTIRNLQGGSTNAIDMNSVSMCVQVTDSNVNSYENATGRKIINQPSLPCVDVRQTPPDGTNNTTYATNLIQGSIRWRTVQGAPVSYWTTPTTNTLRMWGGDPNVPANAAYDFYTGTSGARFRAWENDGATPLFDINAVSGAYQINACSPGFNANNTIAFNCSGGFRLGFGGANYFSFTGSPSAARTITWADASGTPALVLTGTSGSLGGSALTAGSCSSATVSISGATTSMTAVASPASDPGAGFYWLAFVSSSNTVTVRICAAVAGTPTATTYNVRVIQ